MESESIKLSEGKLADSNKPRDELELAVGNLSNSVVLSGGNDE